MIELYNINRDTTIDIEHLGLVEQDTTDVIKECLFLGMDGSFGRCLYKEDVFLLGAMTKVNIKKDK